MTWSRRVIVFVYIRFRFPIVASGHWQPPAKLPGRTGSELPARRRRSLPQNSCSARRDRRAATFGPTARDRRATTGGPRRSATPAAGQRRLGRRGGGGGNQAFFFVGVRFVAFRDFFFIILVISEPPNYLI